MRKLSLPLLGLVTGGLLLACGNNAALAQNQNRNSENRNRNTENRNTDKKSVNETRFERKVNAINDAAKKKGQMDNVLGEVCNNVGLNYEQVQTLHRNHPNAGAGAILVAAVIGDETKQPAEKFLESHLKEGNTWESIIARNNVRMERVDQKLDKVQSALNNPQPPAAAEKRR